MLNNTNQILLNFMFDLNRKFDLPVKPKTRMEWFATMNSAHFIAALRETKIHNPDYYEFFIRDCPSSDSLGSALSSSFIFSSTSKGFDYWHKLINNYSSITKQKNK